MGAQNFPDDDYFRALVANPPLFGPTADTPPRGSLQACHGDVGVNVGAFISPTTDHVGLEKRVGGDFAPPRRAAVPQPHELFIRGPAPSSSAHGHDSGDADPFRVGVRGTADGPSAFAAPIPPEWRGREARKRPLESEWAENPRGFTNTPISQHRATEAPDRDRQRGEWRNWAVTAGSAEIEVARWRNGCLVSEGEVVGVCDGAGRGSGGATGRGGSWVRAESGGRWGRAGRRGRAGRAESWPHSTEGSGERGACGGMSSETASMWHDWIGLQSWQQQQQQLLLQLGAPAQGKGGIPHQWNLEVPHKASTPATPLAAVLPSATPAAVTCVARNPELGREPATLEASQSPGSTRDDACGSVDLSLRLGRSPECQEQNSGCGNGEGSVGGAEERKGVSAGGVESMPGNGGCGLMGGFLGARGEGHMLVQDSIWECEPPAADATSAGAAAAGSGESLSWGEGKGGSVYERHALLYQINLDRHMRGERMMRGEGERAKASEWE